MCQKKNLYELSIKLISEYIHYTAIPIMIQDSYNVKPEDESDEATVQA